MSADHDVVERLLEDALSELAATTTFQDGALSRTVGVSSSRILTGPRAANRASCSASGTASAAAGIRGASSS